VTIKRYPGGIGPPGNDRKESNREPVGEGERCPPGHDTVASGLGLGGKRPHGVRTRSPGGKKRVRGGKQSYRFLGKKNPKKEPLPNGKNPTTTR